MIPFKFEKTAGLPRAVGEGGGGLYGQLLRAAKVEGYMSGVARRQAKNSETPQALEEVAQFYKEDGKSAKNMAREVLAGKRGKVIPFAKKANVNVGGQAVTAPGSMNMPGAGYQQTVGAGAADIPGMSVHCLGCGHKLTKPTPKCPKCGNDTSKVAKNGKDSVDTKPDPANNEVAETGAEAAMNDMKDYSEDQKKLANVLAPVIGGASLVGGAVLGHKLYKPFKQGTIEDRKARVAELVNQGKLPVEEFQKLSSRKRIGNPILNIRLALNRLRGSSKSFRKVVTAGK